MVRHATLLFTQAVAQALRARILARDGRSAMNLNTTAIAMGIDVRKSHLDRHPSGMEAYHQFANTAPGITNLIAWLNTLTPIDIVARPIS